jgi:hypothetical protein
LPSSSQGGAGVASAIVPSLVMVPPVMEDLGPTENTRFAAQLKSTNLAEPIASSFKRQKLRE